jgi:hypothetical protein
VVLVGGPRGPGPRRAAPRHRHQQPRCSCLAVGAKYFGPFQAAPSREISLPCRYPLRSGKAVCRCRRFTRSSSSRCCLRTDALPSGAGRSVPVGACQGAQGGPPNRKSYLSRSSVAAPCQEQHPGCGTHGRDVTSGTNRVEPPRHQRGCLLLATRMLVPVNSGDTGVGRFATALQRP